MFFFVFFWGGGGGIFDEAHVREEVAWLCVDIRIHLGISFVLAS